MIEVVKDFEPVLVCCDNPLLYRSAAGPDCGRCESMLTDAQGAVLVHFNAGQCEWVPVETTEGVSAMGCPECHALLCTRSNGNPENPDDCDRLATGSDGLCDIDRMRLAEQDAEEHKIQRQQEQETLARVKAIIEEYSWVTGINVRLDDLRVLVQMAERGPVE